MKSESDEKKEKLVIEGNAFYEIDLECVRKKERQKNRQSSRNKIYSDIKNRPRHKELQFEI